MQETALLWQGNGRCCSSLLSRDFWIVLLGLFLGMFLQEPTFRNAVTVEVLPQSAPLSYGTLP